MHTKWEKANPQAHWKRLPWSLPEMPAQGGLCPECSSASSLTRGFLWAPPDTGIRMTPGSLGHWREKRGGSKQFCICYSELVGPKAAPLQPFSQKKPTSELLWRWSHLTVQEHLDPVCSRNEMIGRLVVFRLCFTWQIYVSLLGSSSTLVSTDFYPLPMCICNVSRWLYSNVFNLQWLCLWTSCLLG